MKTTHNYTFDFVPHKEKYDRNKNINLAQTFQNAETEVDIRKRENEWHAKEGRSLLVEGSSENQRKISKTKRKKRSCDKQTGAFVSQTQSNNLPSGLYWYCPTN